MCVIIMILVCIYSLHVAESFRNTGEKTNFFRSRSGNEPFAEKKNEATTTHHYDVWGENEKSCVCAGFECELRGKNIMHDSLTVF